MKIIDENGNERNETRTEILARHSRMVADHKEKMDFLESIHNETGLTQISLDAAAEEQKEQAERQADLGLQTEINKSIGLPDVGDTVESCVNLLNKYSNGFKGFIRGTKGEIKEQPYTVDEDKEAAEWAAGLNQKS